MLKKPSVLPGASLQPPGGTYLSFQKYVAHTFSASSINRYAPAAPGVYGLSNARGWIFVGESDDIRSSLFQHMQEGESRLGGEVPRGFSFELVAGKGRTARQQYLIEELQPMFNARVSK